MHRRVYLFAWTLCFVMFLRCNWEGDIKTAGIYCALMFLGSGLNDLAVQITSGVAAGKETETPRSGRYSRAGRKAGAEAPACFGSRGSGRADGRENNA